MDAKSFAMFKVKDMKCIERLKNVIIKDDVLLLPTTPGNIKYLAKKGTIRELVRLYRAGQIKFLGYVPVKLNVGLTKIYTKLHFKLVKIWTQNGIPLITFIKAMPLNINTSREYYIEVLTLFEDKVIGCHILLALKDNEPYAYSISGKYILHSDYSIRSSTELSIAVGEGELLNSEKREALRNAELIGSYKDNSFMYPLSYYVIKSYLYVKHVGIIESAIDEIQRNLRYASLLDVLDKINREITLFYGKKFEPLNIHFSKRVPTIETKGKIYRLSMIYTRHPPDKYQLIETIIDSAYSYLMNKPNFKPFFVRTSSRNLPGVKKIYSFSKYIASKNNLFYCIKNNNFRMKTRRIKYIDGVWFKLGNASEIYTYPILAHITIDGENYIVANMKSLITLQKIYSMFNDIPVTSPDSLKQIIDANRTIGRFGSIQPRILSYSHTSTQIPSIKVGKYNISFVNVMNKNYDNSSEQTKSIDQLIDSYLSIESTIIYKKGLEETYIIMTNPSHMLFKV